MKPETLNPGIRKTVEWLRSLGFETRDSGDGETHDFECDQPMPYVHMTCPPDVLVSETKRLADRLKVVHGIELFPMDGEVSVPCLQASFDPCTGANISLYNVKL